MEENSRRADGSQWVRAVALATALVWVASPALGYEDEFGDTAAWDAWIEGGYRDPFNFRDDFVAAAGLANSEKVFVVGEFGLFGLLSVAGEEAQIEVLESEWNEDLVSAVSLDDGTALAGSATGVIFRYKDGAVARVAEIHNDSVLGLGVERDASGKEVAVWAGGARGLLAKSLDGGLTWSSVAPSQVDQPEIPFGATHTGRRFLGIGNIDPESFVLNARVGGRRAQMDRDYVITFEDGVIEVMNEFDASPAPTIAFKFAPGPPFQAGDFTMSTVVTQGAVVTMAGEFGLVLQTRDSGASWTRLDGEVYDGDPRQPYWINGIARGDTIILVGAAGAIRQSDDGGETWVQHTQPSGDNGVFGVHLGESGDVVVAGAVGMLADFKGGDNWSFADRTRLSVYSWVKSLLPRDGGGLLALGGRGNCVLRTGGAWERCYVRIVESEG